MTTNHKYNRILAGTSLSHRPYGLVDNQPQTGGLCMKGSIYTHELCPVCKSKLTHDENGDYFTCKAHPSEHPPIHPAKCQVRFGRDITKRFQNYREARQFLEGLRFKTVEKTFDKRDYKKNNPLSFANQAHRYLAMKSATFPDHCRKNIKHLSKRRSAPGAVSMSRVSTTATSRTFFTALK